MQPENVKQHPFLSDTQISGFVYYQIPKSLFREGGSLGLGPDEALLYTILRERMKLSCVHNYVDGEGRIYLYYTRSEAAQYLGWSQRKTIDVFRRLVDSNLLSEVAEYSPKGRQTAHRLYIHLWMAPSWGFSPESFAARQFPYATQQTLSTYSMGEYYVLPRMLIEHPLYQGLSLRSVLLYTMTLDRLYLSQQFGRVDENGLLWTTLDPERLLVELDCSQRSLTRAYKELEDIGLLVRKSVQYAEKWRIYLRSFLPPPDHPEAVPVPTLPKGPPAENPPSTPPLPVPSGCVDKITPQCSQICTPMWPDFQGCTANSTAPVWTNLHTNNLSYKNPSLSNLSESESIEHHSQKAVVDGGMPSPASRESCSYEQLDLAVQAYELCHYDQVLDLIYRSVSQQEAEKYAQLLDRCAALLEGDLTNREPYLLFGRRPIRREVVLQRYRELTPHIVFVMLRAILQQQNLRQIHDLDAYLHKSLYEAKVYHSGAAYLLQNQESTAPWGRGTGCVG